MKQKIVIKVQINCDKCRSKAMKLTASAEGVESVAIEGEDKDHLVVIGDRVDSICLTSVLRKKVGRAYIVSVDEVKKSVEKASTVEKPKVVAPKVEAPKVEYTIQWHPPNYYPCSQVVVYDEAYNSNPSSCSIM